MIQNCQDLILAIKNRLRFTGLLNRYVNTTINMELTNRCNLNCVFCDRSVLAQTMKIKDMDSNLLKKILNGISRDFNGKRIYELGLVGLGEPTINTQLREHLRIVDQYRDYFKTISLNSNLVAMDKEKAGLLLNSGVNVYTFSVNSSNRAEYLAMMGRDEFDTVMNNLNAFISLRNAINKNAYIIIQLFESPRNSMNELQKRIYSLSKQRNIHFSLRKMYNKPIVEKNKSGLNIEFPTQKRYPCSCLYSTLYIDVDGNAYPCTIGNDCYREKSNFSIGNANNESLFQILNGDKIRSARSRAEDDNLPFPECDICNIWSLFPNRFKWNSKQQKWRSRKV